MYMYWEYLDTLLMKLEIHVLVLTTIISILCEFDKIKNKVKKNIYFIYTPTVIIIIVV